MNMFLRTPRSIQTKLRVIAILLSLGMVVGAAIAEFVLSRTRAVTELVVNQSAALSLLQAADMSHEGLRSVAYESLLVGQIAQVNADDVRKGVREHAQFMRDAMARLATSDIDADFRAELLVGRASVDRYLDIAQELISAALVDRSAAQARLPQFNAAFDELEDVFQRQIVALRGHNQRAVAHAAEVKTRANLVVAATALIGFVLTAALVGWTGRSIRNSLRKVEAVASAVAGGDIGRRAEIEIDDEIGRLGCAVNAMADKLQHMLAHAVDDSERHRFGRELDAALEMADSEPDAYRVVQRAMAAVSPDHAMELLVSDSSQAMLQRATEHPSAGAPGCTVDSPYYCQAVRGGNSVTFNDSEALSACPRLRGRPGSEGAISAVCVPLRFMGRALGVLHSVGPARRAMQPHQLVQLAAIGAQAAARIGVVRAFERTQLQAATDAATGLANRRALEAAVRELMRKKQPFALLMADLDRFKMLNDTYGHLVGDDALRLFADAMKKAVRDHDIVARWGGEEFAIVLCGSDAQEGCHWADRARTGLAQALENGKVPKFTVSFGVADSTMAERLDDLLRIADEALYRSKEHGRDRATLGSALAANEPMTRQGSEHEEKIDVTRLGAAV
ncbi:MAG: diguanylate cyclase [Rubrivivax sp.]|nr:diguanylate cyclase [Rubrivivax sp.]